jgi:hypothetical protein
MKRLAFLAIALVMAGCRKESGDRKGPKGPALDRFLYGPDLRKEEARKDSGITIGDPPSSNPRPNFLFAAMVSLDFPSIAVGHCETLTGTAKGVRAGDWILPIWPASIPDSGIALIRADNDAVQVRICTVKEAINPPADYYIFNVYRDEEQPQ